jgi:catechol 2,3-dioxygenase-like lactoylglutathione lyase family enzyme
MLHAMEPRDWDRSEHVVDHLDLHASDYEDAVRFYETVLAPLGIPGWPEDSPTERATCFTRLNVVGRRPPTRDLHLCFRAGSRDAVDAFHRAGVDAGFRSNGEPRYREYGAGYYAAYLLDPDGNNLEALYRDVRNVGHEGV